MFLILAIGMMKQESAWLADNKNSRITFPLAWVISRQDRSHNSLYLPSEIQAQKYHTDDVIPVNPDMQTCTDYSSYLKLQLFQRLTNRFFLCHFENNNNS